MSREPLAAQTSRLTHSQPSLPSLEPQTLLHLFLAPVVPPDSHRKSHQKCSGVSARSCESSPAPQKEHLSRSPPTPRNLQRVGSYSPVLEPKEAKGPSNLTHLEPRAWE